MAGAKRGAAEAVDGARALRPRVMPGTAGAAVTPRSAIAGGKRGTRAVRASERGGGVPPGEAAGGERTRRRGQ